MLSAKQMAIANKTKANNFRAVFFSSFVIRLIFSKYIVKIQYTKGEKVKKYQIWKCG